MNREPLLITSLQNDQVKDLVRLRNRRERDERRLTIIEEPLVISRALTAGYPLRTLFFCPEQLSVEALPLLARLQAVPQLEQIRVSAQVMAKVSYRDKPEGLLVVAPQVAPSLDQLDLTNHPDRPALVVILEAVEKPGNLGAVLRIADGAGVQAVLVCGQGTDLFNPNVLRASRGAFFSVPTVAAETAEILAFLENQGITTVAASPSAAIDYSTADLTLPVALVLGTEHDGISSDLLLACRQTVAIPMLGIGDSLNVATSAAILLYEAVRQRRYCKG